MNDALRHFPESYHAGIINDWCKWCVRHERFVDLTEWLGFALSSREAPQLFCAARQAVRAPASVTFGELLQTNGGD